MKINIFSFNVQIYNTYASCNDTTSGELHIFVATDYNEIKKYIYNKLIQDN